MKGKLAAVITVIMMILLVPGFDLDPLNGGESGGNKSGINLVDGTYTPDEFRFSGGTGRVSISCSEVTVQGGQAYATIVFSSGYYSYVKADGATYHGSNTASSSTFEIPVQLNHNNTITGCTTKMSSAHEITYSIFVYIKETADNGSRDSAVKEGETDIPGLTFTRETKIENARYCKIFHYEGGIICIEINMGTGMEHVRYLVVPSGMALPAGLDKEMAVIHRPEGGGKEGGFHAYVASETVIDWMDALGQIQNLSLTGVKKENCRMENVKELLEEKKIDFGGNYNSIQYKTLVLNKCDLAVMPAEIMSAEDEMTKEENASEEPYEAYRKVTGYCSELDIPVFVDMSSREKSEKGKKEWIKVYGALFGCEDEAAELYQTLLGRVKG